MSRTTIQDVARLAGVSKVTVSYVLNGHGSAARISASTSAKILAAAKELNYVPSAVAKTLATNLSKAIAVVLQSGDFFSRNSSFTNEVMRGICGAAVSNGYDIVLHTSPVGSPSQEVNRLRDGRVDGVLVLRDQGDELLEELVRSPLPCVQFFTRSSHEASHWLDTDNFLGGQMAAEHLIELGHRRLAMVGGPEKSVSAQLRREGFEAALRSHAIEPDPSYFVRIPEPGSSADGLAALLQRKDRPTGLFFWSDDVALSCRRVIDALGLLVPKDLSMIGFDSSPACEFSTPPLTSIRQPICEMACAATELLVMTIEKKVTTPVHKVYKPSLDLRGSTSELTRKEVSAEVL